MSAIPSEVWRRWTLPEFDPLRQAVLVFDGNLRKEAAVEMFTDVALLYQEGEGITSVKGVFYITTKRLIFLPKDTVYDPKIVEATFNNLKGLTGVRSDLSISIVDRLNAVANFQFASTRSLYQCFNLLRAMSEASRKPIEEFQREIVKLSSQTTRDETPFSSIEVELEACTHSPEVVEAQNQESEIPVPEGDDETQMVAFVGPVKGFFDYCNHLHFDIHVKLRMLFIISAAAFCMKYIPFVPLVALLVVAYMLRAGWLKIEEDSGVTEPKTESEANKGFNSVRNFVLDYLAWQNIEKSSLVLKVASAIFLGWIILPGKAYTLVCIIAYIVFVAWPIYQSDLLQKIVAGFWFCT